MSEKVQFIGYCINTAPMKFEGKKVYLGLEDAEEDYKKRVALLEAAAEKARTDAKIDPDALKVFVVPEFYFRGELGAYEMDTIMGVGKKDSSIIGELKKSFKASKWRNWLIFAGSIIGHASPIAEKEVEVQDILISAYKPKDTEKLPTDKVPKPVNSEGLTVEEALRITVLTKKFLAAFKKDETVKIQSDLEAKAEEAARSWVQKTTIEDPERKRVVDLVGPEADEEFAGIDDDKKLERYIGKNPFEWEMATDVSKTQEAYNVVPVIIGGTEKVRIAMKEFKSDIDFIKETDVDSKHYGEQLLRRVLNHEDVRDDRLSPLWELFTPQSAVIQSKLDALANDPKYGEGKVPFLKFWTKKKYKEVVEFDPLGIFKIGNISFAVEVCLDHSYQSAKVAILRLNQDILEPFLEKILPKASIDVVKAAKTGVDVHLVPSCGMSIKKKAVVAKENGYVFNCDGLNGKIQFDTANSAYVKIDASDNALDADGYKSNAIDGEASSIGNGHTGLAKVTSLKMAPGESEVAPVDTTTKVKSIDLGMTTVASTDIDNLYHEGYPDERLIQGRGPEGNKDIMVKANSPIGGTIHIYDVVEV